MRNLADCKAEVFRRSNERIKERKRKRNRVLACCIPLCLLLVAGGIYIRPLLQPADELLGTTNEHRIPDRELGGIAENSLPGTARYSSVEITDRTGDAEVFRKVTASDAVEELCRIVTESFAATDHTTGSGNKTSGNVKENVETAAGQDRDTIIDEVLKTKFCSQEKQADYTLIILANDGAEFVYRLCGNVLYDDRNDCAVTLTDTQLSVLKTQIETLTADGNSK